MPISEKTLKIYEEADFRYHFDADDKAHLEWRKKIVDGKGNLNAPIKDLVHRIYRIKARDGKEYIAWAGHWEGIQISELDKSRRRITFPTSSKDFVLTYTKPIIDKGEPYLDMRKRGISYPTPNEIGRETVYECEWSIEKCKELMAQADPTRDGGFINFYVISEIAGGGIGGKNAPVAIHDVNCFMNEDFDELIKTGSAPAPSSANTKSSSSNTTNKQK